MTTYEKRNEHTTLYAYRKRTRTTYEKLDTYEKSGRKRVKRDKWGKQ